MTGRWSRLLPLTGVAAVVLIAVAFAVGGETPDFDDPGAKVVKFYVDHKGSQITGSILIALGALFLLVFSAVVRSALRKAEPPGGDVSALLLAGGVVLTLGLLIFAGLTFTLADGGKKLDPAAAQALNALNGDFFFPVAVGTSALMLAATAAILRTGALPRWLGWAALVLGIVAVTPGGFFAFLASGIWYVVASVLLYRRPAAAGAPG